MVRRSFERGGARHSASPSSREASPLMRNAVLSSSSGDRTFLSGLALRGLRAAPRFYITPRALRVASDTFAYASSGSRARSAFGIFWIRPVIE